MAHFSQYLRKAIQETKIKGHTRRTKTGVSPVRASTQRRKAGEHPNEPNWGNLDAGKVRWEQGDIVYFVGGRTEGRGYRVLVYNRSTHDIQRPFGDKFWRTADAAQEAMDKHVRRLGGYWKPAGIGL